MHNNTVLLPDSSMVTVGGGNNSGLYGTTSSQRQVELYDPITRAWRLGPAQAEDRLITPPRFCCPMDGCCRRATPTPTINMLFVLNGDGVPSVARWMQLRADAPATAVNP